MRASLLSTLFDQRKLGTLLHLWHLQQKQTIKIESQTGKGGPLFILRPMSSWPPLGTAVGVMQQSRETDTQVLDSIHPIGPLTQCLVPRPLEVSVSSGHFRNFAVLLPMTAADWSQQNIGVEY
jgi:hypothetical protein